MVPLSAGFPNTYFSISTIHTAYPDLLNASAEGLVAGMAHGRWCSVDLTKVSQTVILIISELF
jgi:hypothetical protein